MAPFQNLYRVESTRLEGWDYSSRGWYFITVCTKDKKCYFGTAFGGEIVLSNAGVIAAVEMKAISIHYSNVILDRYVVMPNHVHAIIVIDGCHMYSPGHIVLQTHAEPSKAIDLRRDWRVQGRSQPGMSLSRHPRFSLAVEVPRSHPAIKRLRERGSRLHRP